MMLYRDVLKRALYITWRNKSLWFFGFLAMFWGIGGVYEVATQAFRLATGREFYLIRLWQSFANVGGEQGFFASLWAAPVYGLMFILILVVLFLIALLFWWIFTCSQIAVIKQVADIDGNSRKGALVSFYEGRKHFWPVFGLNMLVKIFDFIALVILSYGVMKVILPGGEMISATFYLLIFILFAAVIVTVSFLLVYSVIYVTVKGQSMGRAIGLAWKLFTKNWLVSLETAAIMFLVTILVAIGMGVLAQLFSGALYVVSIVILFINIPSIYFIVFSLLILIFALVAILTAAALSTFQLATWVELFDHLEAGRVVSKIQRVASDKLGL